MYLKITQVSRGTPEKRHEHVGAASRGYATATQQVRMSQVHIPGIYYEEYKQERRPRAIKGASGRRRRRTSEGASRATQLQERYLKKEIYQNQPIQAQEIGLVWNAELWRKDNERECVQHLCSAKKKTIPSQATRVCLEAKVARLNSVQCSTRLFG